MTMENVTYVGGLFSDTYRVHEHIHKTYELVYYTMGSGLVRIGEDNIDFSPGTITLIAPEIPHTDFASGGFQNLYFHLLHPGIPMHDYALVKDNENRDIFKILFQMHSEYHYKRQNWRALVDSLYEVLHQYLLSFMETKTLNPYVEHTMHEIIANLSNPSFDLRETIRSVPFHPNYFRDLFARETGYTPNQYLTAKRMDYARELIISKSSTGYSFKEIALLCGYNDAYYFSRLFRQYTGFSPKDWLFQKAWLQEKT